VTKVADEGVGEPDELAVMNYELDVEPSASGYRLGTHNYWPA
jgi:hypothetical protein